MFVMDCHSRSACQRLVRRPPLVDIVRQVEHGRGRSCIGPFLVLVFLTLSMVRPLRKTRRAGVLGWLTPRVSLTTIRCQSPLDDGSQHCPKAPASRRVVRSVSLPASSICIAPLLPWLSPAARNCWKRRGLARCYVPDAEPAAASPANNPSDRGNTRDLRGGR